MNSEAGAQSSAVMRQVILITDGDQVAKRAVELAGAQVGARVISRSAGNPTPLSGEELLFLIFQAEHDPVLVMFDDNGDGHYGLGEEALQTVAEHPSIEIIGVLAVASHTPYVKGARVDFSIDCNGRVLEHAVDKNGEPLAKRTLFLKGDTVDVLKDIQCPLVVGIGDPGKMKGKDSLELGAPITTAAIRAILGKNN
ncbi:MAG: stage sporulation protein [Bacilli bacterium]|nr:stage sporulation protein [Bacilli bacterium]